MFLVFQNNLEKQNGCVYGLNDERTEERTAGCSGRTFITDGRTYGQTDGRTDGRTGGQADGLRTDDVQMDLRTYCFTAPESHDIM